MSIVRLGVRHAAHHYGSLCDPRYILTHRFDRLWPGKFSHAIDETVDLPDKDSMSRDQRLERQQTMLKKPCCRRTAVDSNSIYIHFLLYSGLGQWTQYGVFKVMTELAAAFWVFDRVIRWAARIYLSFSFGSRSTVSSRKGVAIIECASAQIQAYGVDADYTRLRIAVPASKLRFADQQPSLIRGVAAGDDVRITIPRLQWVGEHPFTVFATGTSKDDPSQGNIDLLIKTGGGLTRKLAHHAVNSSKTNGEDKDIEMVDASADQPSIAVLIEGPFGTAPEIGESTTELVLVAGGIGITFCWPLFVAAFRSCLSAVDKSSLTSCKLVWIVRHEGTSLAPLNFASP